MKVAILGGGNGGLAAAVDLSLQGHDIRLWNRSPGTIDAIKNRGVQYQGVLGKGTIKLTKASEILEKIVKNSDVLLICLPTIALGDLAHQLAELKTELPPIVLNPGHTGGSLEFIHSFRKNSDQEIAVAEFSTLTYVARKFVPYSINITGKANHVWVASLPGGAVARIFAQQLYPFASKLDNVVGTGLANVNMVLHPPGSILGAAWIESTKGDYTFYVEGLPVGVGRIMESLDKERLQVAGAFGLTLPSLFDEMKRIGTVEKDANPVDGLAHSVRSGKANSKIKAPDSLHHRFYLEDFWYGLKPFLEFAGIAGIDIPVTQSLLHLATVLLDKKDTKEGRSAEAMGIDNMNLDTLLNYINE